MKNLLFFEGRKAYLEQSTSHGHFFLVRVIHKFYHNDYLTTAKTYLRYIIFYDCSEIAIGNTKN